jgi:hypothetical protein
MFGFGTRQGKARVDPLATRRTAAEWFRDLPALDVFGRQEQLAQALHAMRHAQTSVDLDRVAALLYVDGAAAADRGRVQKWYIDNCTGASKLAESLWQTCIDVNHGFLYAYRAAVDQALTQAEDRHWEPLLPLLFARLVHAHGIDARLRMLRSEPWIPMKWGALHRLFLQAAELGIERIPCALDRDNPLSTRSTVEHEYLHVLLQQRLDTGNLTPAELEWASTQVHALSASLALEDTPTGTGGFFVDLAGTAGLVRRSGNDEGTQVGYLDTTPLVAGIDQALARLRAPAADSPSRLHRHDRTSILERIRPALEPRRSAELRRHPRVATDVATALRVGLQRIARDLAAHAIAAPAAVVPRSTAAASALAVATAEVTTKLAAGAGPRAATAAADTIASTLGVDEVIEIRPPGNDVEPAAAAPAVPAPAPVEVAPWRMKDHSAAGCRISAPVGADHGLALGALVGLWTEDINACRLGVVRRLARNANDGLDAGIAVIADQVVAVSLHSRRNAQDDLGFVVDGVDISTLGTRFPGLYLKPSAALADAPQLRTLIIPTAEHVEGRNLLLATAKSIYAVTLSRLIDQRADWSWVTIQIAARAPLAA